VLMSDFIDERFQASDIGQAVHLMSLLVASIVHVSNGIQELHASLPFWNGELDLPGEVVEMLYEGCEDDSVARSGVGAHSIDDILGEVRIEPVGHVDSCL